LLDTLQTLRKGWQQAVAAGKTKGLMLVGRRTNVDYQGQELSSDQAATELGRRGELFQTNAMDYFLYSRGAEDWAHIPDFVVGRRAYDNWLVEHAYDDARVDLVDASNTVLALHLSAKDGMFAGHKKGSDNDYNIMLRNPTTGKDIMSDIEDGNGVTDHCPFFTVNHAGAVAVEVREHHARGRRLPAGLHQGPPDAPAAAPTPPASQPTAGAPPPPQPPRGIMCNALANIFTTFIENSKDARKNNAQIEVLKAFERLRPHGIQVWLFTNSDEWARR